jgi:putative transposase
VRDAIVAFISYDADRTEIPVSKLLKWLGLSRGRYYRWVARYGQENQHNVVEIILQRANERYPLATPRVISDNGPQFIAKDFKEYIRLMGMTHVRTSPFYPQSNGKLERWHKSLKQEVIRPKVPLSLEDVRCLVGEYVSDYNTERLHSAMGYITPQDKMEGRAQAIFEARREKRYAANNEAMA